MSKNIWKSILTKNKIKYKIKKNVLECGRMCNGCFIISLSSLIRNISRIKVHTMANMIKWFISSCYLFATMSIALFELIYLLVVLENDKQKKNRKQKRFRLEKFFEKRQRRLVSLGYSE